MRLSYNHQARQELERITRWYNHERAGLGSQFVDRVEEVVLRILDHPESFGIVGRNHRMADLKPFPYGILFRIMDDVIRIKCIRHHSRHPRFGFGRK